MHILICGTREWEDTISILSHFQKWLPKHRGKHILVHGAARGADTFGCQERSLRKRLDFAYDKAMELGFIDVLPFAADWTNLTHPEGVIRTNRIGQPYDVLAGFRRNQRMIDEGQPDYALIFHPNLIRGKGGTGDMYDRIIKAGIPREVFDK